MWGDIMVSGLIFRMFRWYILERTEMWRRSKENCSNDATCVYVCESNKDFSENMASRECILEWVINGATASLNLLNRSDSAAMHRYQWLSNTYAWHYLLTTLLLTHKLHKSARKTRMTRLLAQQLSGWRLPPRWWHQHWQQ